MKRSFVLIPLLTLFCLPLVVSAEFICRADVSYKWKKAKAEGELEVYFASVERAGADEVTAKREIGEALAKEKIRAFDGCKKEHQELVSCISTKYTAVNSTIQTLGFAARKALEDAITADCNGTQGECQSSSANDPKCEEKVAPVSGKEGEAGKKEEKGKEKKK